MFRSSLCGIRRCYLFNCEIISRLCRCVYLQLFVYAMSYCDRCSHRVSIGVFIYSQNRADYEQGNACCSKVEKKNQFYASLKGSSRLGEERRRVLGDLTPSYGAEFEHVEGKIGVEDPDQRQVHVDGLQAHPGEGGQ